VVAEAVVAEAAVAAVAAVEEVEAAVPLADNAPARVGARATVAWNERVAREAG